MNLKDGRGKVPIINSTQNEATPYLLVDFPKITLFLELYAKHSSAALKYKYWNILRARSDGQTLEQAGKPYGITRERVRQIEARFQRLVGKKYSTQNEANLSMLSSHQSLLESFLNSEMHEKSPPSDDSH